MDHDPRQAALLARILIAKHGAGAARVAAERVLQWARIGDDETAALWVEVVEIAMNRLASQPSLEEDELDGLVDELRGELSHRSYNSLAQTSVPRTKHMIPRAGVQQTTARPTGLSVRCNTLSSGTVSHSPLMKAS